MKKYHAVMNRIYLLVIVVAIFTGCQKNSNTSPSSANSRVDGRVDSVLALMTLEEKIGQLTLFTSDYDVTGPTIRENYKDDIKAGKVGAIFNAFGADYTRKLQEIAVKETRLHIPLLFGYDVIHGHRTIFPIPLGESCSWDLNVMQQSARIAAEEASAEGLHCKGISRRRYRSIEFCSCLCKAFRCVWCSTSRPGLSYNRYV
jgi:beta-glucosidase